MPDMRQYIGSVVLIAMMIGVIVLGITTYSPEFEVTTLIDAVVVIEVEGPYGDSWTGAGTIINKDGVILTVAHVLDEATNITVTLKDKRQYEIDISTIYVYPDWNDYAKQPDVGFCRIDTNDILPYTLMAESSLDLEVGTEVTILGHPYLEIYWTSFGHIARPPQNGQLQLDVDSNPGNSGGPILYNDKVIGAISWGWYDSDLSYGPSIELYHALFQIYELLYE